MVVGHHVCAVSFSCMVLGREDWTCAYFCCHALTSNMLLLQKAVHASTALDGPGGQTCHCSDAHRFTGDLQIGCAAFLLRTWRRQPFGSTIIEQCVPARGPGTRTFYFAVLYFLSCTTCFGRWPSNRFNCNCRHHIQIYSVHFGTTPCP